jgi:hypothetical protein
MENAIYLAAKTMVLAIDRQTGLLIWEVTLSRKWFMSGSVNLIYDKDLLFAYHDGLLFCIDPKNGKILWESKLHLGWGVTHAIFATQSTSQQQAVIGEMQRQRAASAANTAGAAT